MGQSRYIQMNGDPVPFDEPLRQTFYRAADVKSAVCAAGLSYVMNPDQLPSTKTELHTTPVFSTLISNAVDIVFWRMWDKHRVSFASLGDKCIDTRPDKSTPPTTAKYGLQAECMRQYYVALGGLILALDGISIAAHSLQTKQPGIALINKAFGNAALYTRMIGGYNRFNRVVKGEWQIVDMPTPEMLREAAGKKAESPSMTPQPI